MYPIHNDLKGQIRRAGLTIRDIAVALREPPGTTGNRLNGYLPLRAHQRAVILEALKSSEVGTTEGKVGSENA